MDNSALKAQLSALERLFFKDQMIFKKYFSLLNPPKIFFCCNLPRAGY